MVIRKHTQHKKMLPELAWRARDNDDDLEIFGVNVKGYNWREISRFLLRKIESVQSLLFFMFVFNFLLQ